MESKKGSTVLWIIIIILVLVIAIGSYFIFSSGEGSSESSENIVTNEKSTGGEAIVNGDEKINLEENEDDSTNQDSNEGSPSSNNLFCTDSDGGKNYDEKGETCNEVDCRVDSCLKGVSGDFDLIAEYYCKNNQRESESRSCDYLCEEGACILKPKPKCTDTDEGIDYGIKGKVITENIPGNSGEFEDKCLDSEELMENYCGSGEGYYEGLEVAKVTMYKCPNRCQDGVCI